MGETTEFYVYSKYANDCAFCGSKEPRAYWAGSKDVYCCDSCARAVLPILFVDAVLAGDPVADNRSWTGDLAREMVAFSAGVWKAAAHALQRSIKDSKMNGERRAQLRSITESIVKAFPEKKDLHRALSWLRHIPGNDHHIYICSSEKNRQLLEEHIEEIMPFFPYSENIGLKFRTREDALEWVRRTDDLPDKRKGAE